MKLYKVFLIVLMTSAFAVVGCGDGGGGDAGNACSGPICRANDVLRGTCEAEFNDCIERGVNTEECFAAAALVCGNIL
jgi:hypothetical protein